MNLKPIILTLFSFLLFINCFGINNQKNKEIEKHSPRIINIINFIRQNDYRVNNSENLLFETVQEQIKLVNQYDFPATFLFQYDALIDVRYQELMKAQLSTQCEIGAWWEITQPHVEAAGIKWRGNHPWVSTANIAFTTGYTPHEREKLVDVYMAKFYEIYGKYPKSVGSWYIDSHTLSYMYQKYNITASCNCKDQVGTDGYTLWGGYWNQAYYPSKKNAYMPAQTQDGQIPVPIFRMLGSDPIYQYETGVGTSGQGVISLEPVYGHAGKDKKWVNYFLESIVNQPSLAFNYAQAGQENSFTWNEMAEGLKMQFPIFDQLRKQNKIQIETLEHSGNWFKEHFAVTPPTAVTTLSDTNNRGDKSIWYNSRYYRVSLLWQDQSFCFRDIHLFDEKFESDYLKKPGTGGQFFYYTLPIVDRFFWSTTDQKTGLRIIKTSKDGQKQEVKLLAPIVTEPSKKILKIESADKDGNKFTIVLHEDRIDVLCKTNEKDLDWILELKVPNEKVEGLPFRSVQKSSLNARFKNFDYKITCNKGSIERGNNLDYVYRLIPSKNKLSINCTNN